MSSRKVLPARFTYFVLFFFPTGTYISKKNQTIPRSTTKRAPRFYYFLLFFSGIRHNCWALSLSSPSFPQRASPSSSAATLCHATTGGRGETERKRKRENPWMVGLERERPPKAAAALASSSYSVAARTEEEEEEEVFARPRFPDISKFWVLFGVARSEV